jgi:acyl-coenzyme A thioesterase PaaI-like protein
VTWQRSRHLRRTPGKRSGFVVDRDPSTTPLQDYRTSPDYWQPAILTRYKPNFGDPTRPDAQLEQSGQLEQASALMPHTSFVGLQISIRSGEMLSVLRRREANISNTQRPAIHGKVVGATLEHAGIIEWLYRLKLAAMPRVINVSIDYLRAVKVEDLWLRGYIVCQGRRIANVRCEAWQENREQLAAASYTQLKLS